MKLKRLLQIAASESHPTSESRIEKNRDTVRELELGTGDIMIWLMVANRKKLLYYIENMYLLFAPGLGFCCLGRIVAW